MKKTLGVQITITYNQCDLATISDRKGLCIILEEAVAIAGGTIVDKFAHTFTPYGITNLLVLAESHLISHTWPEHGILILDIFICTPDPNLEAAILYVQDSIQAKSFSSYRQVHEVEV